MDRGDVDAREDGDTWDGSPGKSMGALDRMDSPSRGAGDFGESTRGGKLRLEIVDRPLNIDLNRPLIPFWLWSVMVENSEVMFCNDAELRRSLCLMPCCSCWLPDPSTTGTQLVCSNILRSSCLFMVGARVRVLSGSTGYVEVYPE